VTSDPLDLRIALARTLLRPAESAAAYQIDVSTNRVIAMRQISDPESIPSRVKGLSDHGMFIPCDISPAGITEIENAIDLSRGFRTGKIARDKTAHIFCQRYTKFARSLARTSLYLAFERNLRS
jgi:hypothetical protein